MLKRAVIWDMDGVIADTASLHYAAWRQLLRQRGRNLKERQFRETFGQRNREIVKILFGYVPDERALRAISDEKEALYRAAAAKRVRCLPGVAQLLTSLANAGWLQAIGSSAPLENIEMILDRLRLGRFFSAIVGEDDVIAGKPDPEIFLTAALRLAVPPRACVVIEDAVAGVEAAKAAGMACVAVTNTRPREELARADLVVASLDEVGVDTLTGLVARSATDRMP